MAVKGKTINSTSATTTPPSAPPQEFVNALDATWGFNENPWWDPDPDVNHTQISYHLVTDSDAATMLYNQSNVVARDYVNAGSYGVGADTTTIISSYFFDVMDQLESFLNVSFTDTMHDSGMSVVSGYDLTIRLADLEKPTAGVGLPVNFEEGVHIGADVLIDTFQGELPYYSLSVNSLVLHEMGHVMGLAHTHQLQGGTGIMPEEFDNNSYSVMSYTGKNEKNLSYTPLDIAVLQMNYGANNNYMTGDDSYDASFLEDLSADYNVNPWPMGDVIYTIWDAGGIDEINLSDVEYESSRIDLREGMNPTSIESVASDNEHPYTVFLYMAYNVTIENAVGGAGTDIMNGNEADNLLHGLGGNDVIASSDGYDVLYGGDGRDAFYIASGMNGHTTIADFNITEDSLILVGLDGYVFNEADIQLSAGGGSTDITAIATNDSGDTKSTTFLLNGVEISSLSDINSRFETASSEERHITQLEDPDANFYASALEIVNDYVIGSSGNNIISTGYGDDIAYGMAGNDFLVGNEDNDSLFGGDDDDQLFGKQGSDHISGGQGYDTLKGGEGSDNLYGDSGNDTISGGAGDDYINGGDDDDEIDGGDGDDVIDGDDAASPFTGGDDVIIGGAGSDTMSGGIYSCSAPVRVATTGLPTLMLPPTSCGLMTFRQVIPIPVRAFR